MKPRTLAVLAAVLPGGLALAPISANAGETVTETIRSDGVNLSISTAENIDPATTDSDTVRQNATSFTSGGQPVSPLPVTINLNLTVLGSLAGPSSTNYFAFDEAPGAPINVHATATSPPDQATELQLFDNGNLVAVAGGAFGLQDPGGAGTWVAGVTQGFGVTSAIDYKLQFAISTAVPFTTNVIGSGQMKNGSLGSYDVAVNAGDQLTFDLRPTTPSTMAGLELFDNNGNLVGVAGADGPDGLSSIITFTVPSGEAGDWTIEVAPSFGGGGYAYDLAIEGATGFGPINPTPVPEAPTWAALMVGFVGLALVGRAQVRRAIGAPR